MASRVADMIDVAPAFTTADAAAMQIRFAGIDAAAGEPPHARHGRARGELRGKQTPT